MPAPAPELDPHPATAPTRGQRRVVLLGSTGSIGTQTLDVIASLNRAHEQGRHPVRYTVVGLAAGSNSDTLARQAAQCPGAACAIARAGGNSPAGALIGPDAPERLVRDLAPDLVVSAIVGAAGLPATLAAAELGADIALANKEALVAAGSLVVEAARRSGARLLPVDSEHAAVWQALSRVAPDAQRTALCPPCTAPPEVARIVLTASGGAFRDTPLADLPAVTPDAALAHPTWAMGDKITIDCATMVNKAFELLEAHWLFGVDADRLGVLVHRQSIVHSLVTYHDGNTIAQLGPSDMRIAIQHALTFPHRLPSPAAALDLASAGPLTFEPPDDRRYPALALAWRVLGEGGTAGAVFNAANEQAVAAFLARQIPFTRIADLCALALDALPAAPVRCLGDAMDADARARAFVASHAGPGA